MVGDLYEATQRFLVRLREDPELRRKPPRKIAEEMGVPEEIVRSVLSGIRRSRKHSLDREALRRFWSETWAAVRVAVSDLVAKPYQTLGISTGLLILVAYLATEGVEQKHWYFLFAGILGFISVGLTVILQIAMLYRLAQQRFALLLGFLWFGASFVLLIVAPKGFISVDGETSHSIFLTAFIYFAASLGMGFTIGTVAAFFAAVGALMHLRKVRKQSSSNNRRFLLQLRMELRRRLSLATRQPKTVTWWDRMGDYYRLNSVRFPIFAGIAIGCSGVIGNFFEHSSSFGTAGFVLGVLLRNTSSLAAFGYLLYVTWFSTGLGQNYRAYFLEKLVASLIGGLAALILRGLAMTYFMELISGFVGASIAIPILALLFSVQKYSNRQKRLEVNDPTVLIEELALVEWKLQQSTQSTAVLVVDAVSSSKMKLESDPMTAELAFRFYQDWIAEIAHQFKGKIHSTAGDGAVIAFPSAGQAYTCACHLLQNLDEFNKLKNPLTIQFRIRLGIHKGQVAGSIDEVVFTEVIDIAAHVEKVAPINGIAVTSPAADEIAHEHPTNRFALLPEEVDRLPVMVAVQ